MRLAGAQAQRHMHRGTCAEAQAQRHRGAGTEAQAQIYGKT